MLKDIVCRWIEKAKNDLEIAEIILGEGFHGESAFHSQQAAEKALKALLVALNMQPPRSHNIHLLLRLLEERGIDTIVPRRIRAERLTVYAVETRYPDFGEEPSAEEAAEALSLAKQVVEWAREKLKEMRIECQ